MAWGKPSRTGARVRRGLILGRAHFPWIRLLASGWGKAFPTPSPRPGAPPFPNPTFPPPCCHWHPWPSLPHSPNLRSRSPPSLLLESAVARSASHLNPEAVVSSHSQRHSEPRGPSFSRHFPAPAARSHQSMPGSQPDQSVFPPITNPHGGCPERRRCCVLVPNYPDGIQSRPTRSANRLQGKHTSLIEIAPAEY